MLNRTQWRTMIILGIVMLIVAACQNDADPVPQSAPNTPLPPASQVAQQVATQAPEVATQVVTRAPTRTPFPTTVPTVPVEFVPYEGAWTLLLRYEITGSSIIDQIIYSTSVPIIIAGNGTVFGAGEFSPTFASERCAVQAVNPNSLTFVVSGGLRPAGETILADLILTPNDPTLAEAYTATCLDPLNGTEFTDEIEVSLLWTVLTGGEQLNFSFDMASFIHRIDLPVQEVTTLTANQYDGQLVGEVYFGK